VSNILVFDFIAYSPFGFWIVAFLLIAADSTLLLLPEQFTFAFGRKLNIRLRILANPYLLRKKQAVVTLFVYPLAPYFISTMTETPRSRRETKRLLLRQKRITAYSTPLVNLASLALALVCVVGPAIGLLQGIERSLIIVVPALYVSAIAGAGIIWLNRSIFGLDWRGVIHIFIELIVCPVFVVNVFKRIALRQPGINTTDLISYFSEDKAEVSERLQRYVEETAE
jgi:hypothetical protein